jgi:hypothetical protein
MDPLQDYFDRLIAVDDLEDHLTVDKFLEYTKTTEPTIQISLNQIFLFHSLMIANQKIVVRLPLPLRATHSPLKHHSARECKRDRGGQGSERDRRKTERERETHATKQPKRRDGPCVARRFCIHPCGDVGVGGGWRVQCGPETDDPMYDVLKRMGAAVPAQVKNTENRVVMLCLVDRQRKRLESSLCCPPLPCPSASPYPVWGCDVMWRAAISKEFRRSVAPSAATAAHNAEASASDLGTTHPVFAQTQHTLLTLLRSLPTATDAPGLYEFLVAERDRALSVQPPTSASKQTAQSCDTALRACQHLLQQGVWTVAPGESIETSFSSLLAKFSEVAHPQLQHCLCRLLVGRNRVDVACV